MSRAPIVLVCLMLVMLGCSSDPTRTSEYMELLDRAEEAESAATEARSEADTALRRIRELEDELQVSREENQLLAENVQSLRHQIDTLFPTVALHRSLVDVEPFLRSCGSDVYGTLDERWQDDSVEVGPIAFAYLLQLSDPGLAEDFDQREADYPAHKILAVVKTGLVVTVVIPEHERAHLSMLYDRGAWQEDNAHEVTDGDTATTFIPCQRPPHTQFNGGFIVAGPRCSDLDILIGKASEPVRVRVSFGSGTC